MYHLLAEAPTSIPRLDSTMGALLLGVMFAMGLWGVTSVSTWAYFTDYYNLDSRHLKFMVAATYLFDTVHQIMLFHLIYTYLVVNFFNPAILDQLIWSILIMVLMTAFIALITQLFLAWRVWILSNHNRVVICVILFLILGEFGATLAYFIQSWPMKTYDQLKTLSILSRVVNGFGAASDISITLALSTYLWTSKSGMKNTDAIMNRMILFCLRTGLLTTSCAVASLISITVWPNTFIYITFYCCLARFYSTSFLATLNARKQLREQNRNGNGSIFIGSISLSFDPPSLNSVNLTNRSLRTVETTSENTFVTPSQRPLSIKQDIEVVTVTGDDSAEGDFELKRIQNFEVV